VLGATERTTVMSAGAPGLRWRTLASDRRGLLPHAICVVDVPIARDVTGRRVRAARAFRSILPMQMIDSVGAIGGPGFGDEEGRCCGETGHGLPP
jgi:hypothetical protein